MRGSLQALERLRAGSRRFGEGLSSPGLLVRQTRRGDLVAGAECGPLDTGLVDFFDGVPGR